MGYDVSEDKGMMIVKKDERKEYITGIIPEKQVSTGKYFISEDIKIKADVPATATYQEGFEKHLKQYKISYDYDPTPEGEITSRIGDTPIYGFETETITVGGRDIVQITGKKIVDYRPPPKIISWIKKVSYIPDKLSYKIQDPRYRAKHPETATLISVGLMGWGATTGFVKGATAPIRPKFYTEEIPGTIHLITHPSEWQLVGQELKERPWNIAEMIGYMKGFKTMTSWVGKKVLKPKTEIPPGVEVEKISLLQRLKMGGGEAIMEYKPTRVKVKGKVRTPKGGYELWRKKKEYPDTVRSKAYEETMTGIPKERVMKPRTEITKEIETTTTPYRTKPFEEMTKTLEREGRFGRVSETMGRRQKLLLVEEDMYIPETTPTVVAGMLVARTLTPALSVAQLSRQILAQKQSDLMKQKILQSKKVKEEMMARQALMPRTRPTQRQRSFLIQSPAIQQKTILMQRQDVATKQKLKQIQIPIMPIAPKLTFAPFQKYRRRRRKPSKRPFKTFKRKYRYMPDVVSYERKQYARIKKGVVYAPITRRLIPQQFKGILERAEKIKYVYRKKRRKRR